MKITSKFRMTARLSGTDLALKPLLCSKVPVISRLLKYKLCPPPFVSRVLLSWQLVDPYRYESSCNSEFYGDLVYKFKKIIGNPNFSNLFKRIVNRFKRAGYSLDIMRQTACLVVNPIMVEGLAALFSCTVVVQASDSMTASM